jgi:hypothetical protein
VRQALHIFKKDVRYLRWELGLLLLFMGMFVYIQNRRGEVSHYVSMAFLLPCLWAFLCGRLIHAEPIPGDRQFWITRPYEWRSLLGAKLLFMVAFLSVPLLFADAVILAMQGFSVVASIPGLLWSVMLITASMLMAFCAFATLTRGLVQWILSIGAFFGLSTVASERDWGAMAWARDHGFAVIVFFTAVVVLLGQYKRRRTTLSIIVMALGLVAAWLYFSYLPSAAAFELETRFSEPKVDTSAVQIAVHVPAGRVVPRPEPHREQTVALAIPVDVSGLGEGQDLISDQVRISIVSESGGTWSRSGDASDNLEHVPGGYRLLLRIDRAVLDGANGRPVRLEARFYVTLLGDPVSKVLRYGAGAVDVPGAGICRAHMDTYNTILCESPLRRPSNFPAVSFGGERGDWFLDAGTSYSPFPGDLWIIPLHWYGHSGSATFAPATVTSLEPLAHFRRDLDLRGVYLADYQL